MEATFNFEGNYFKTGQKKSITKTEKKMNTNFRLKYSTEFYWIQNNGIDSSSYEFQEFCTHVKPEILDDGSFKKDDEGKIKTQFYEDFRQRLDKNRNIILSTAEVKKPIHCQHKEYQESCYNNDGIPAKSGWVKCKMKLEDNDCCPEHGYSTANVINTDNRSEKPHISRGQAKELFATWLNGDNTLPTLINAIFGIYYPGIVAIVDTHKNGNKNYMYEQLVSFETNFIFNIICARLYTEIPNIQIITCHDEIYFEQKFKTQVEAIWQQELMKVYEILPSIECNEVDEIKETFVNNEEFDSGKLNDSRNWRMLGFDACENFDDDEL